MIEPPDYILPNAVPAWHRITSALERRGDWKPEFRIMAYIAATQCASYCSCIARDRQCRRFGFKSDEGEKVTEECRQLARLMLSDMCYLSIERVPVALLDADGHDADLIAICAPLTEGDD